MTDLSKRFLFRMTHIANIPHVLQHGLTHRTSSNCNPNFVSIGDGSIISKRNDFALPNQGKLGDYIPFYFGPRMPMLYVIQGGYSQVQRVSPGKIVYCITSVADIITCSSISFLFTNGHAFSQLSEFFTSADLPNIEQIIDQKAIESQYWRDEKDLDLKRRMEAEFLILGDLPVSAIRGYAVYDQTAKTTLTSWGISADKVVVKPGYYF